MAYYEVRPAAAGDREAVLAFCAHTWEDGDYIDGEVWDEWLHDTRGQLFVAVVAEKAVGLVRIQMLDQSDAWLEGLRVDPEHRRHGIARALTETALLAAMQHGATHVRLTTDSNNTSSIHLFESLHMRQVGGFAFYTASPLHTPANHQQVQLAQESDIDDIIDYLNVSNTFPLTGGLYHLGFVAYRITAELLAEKVARQHLYLLRRWDRVDGLAIAEPRKEFGERSLSLGYIDGTTIEAISLLAYDLRERLPIMELERLHAYAPDLVLVHDAFKGIGYESRDMLFYTYERGLT